MTSLIPFATTNSCQVSIDGQIFPAGTIQSHSWNIPQNTIVRAGGQILLSIGLGLFQSIYLGNALHAAQQNIHHSISGAESMTIEEFHILSASLLTERINNSSNLGNLNNQEVEFVRTRIREMQGWETFSLWGVCHAIQIIYLNINPLFNYLFETGIYTRIIPIMEQFPRRFFNNFLNSGEFSEIVAMAEIIMRDNS